MAKVNMMQLRETPEVVTDYVCPPIPTRCADWVAYFEGDETGPCGHGRTELEALEDLIWQIETAAEDAAVMARITALKEAV